MGAVTQLSQHLVSRGLHSVKIIGPESSNADSVNLAMVKACGAVRACWLALDAIASHSYGMAATESWANATEEGGQRKGYWVTESGAFVRQLRRPNSIPRAASWQVSRRNHGVQVPQ